MREIQFWNINLGGVNPSKRHQNRTRRSGARMAEDEIEIDVDDLERRMDGALAR
jgi:hypothetical protein